MDLQTKINTLNSLLPQQVPFVMAQVSEAVKVATESDNFERNLDVAIAVAEQVNKYSGGEMLYNYTPNIYYSFVPQGYGIHIVVMIFLYSFHNFNMNVLLGKERVGAQNILFIIQFMTQMTSMIINIFIFNTATGVSALIVTVFGDKKVD